MPPKLPSISDNDAKSVTDEDEEGSENDGGDHPTGQPQVDEEDNAPEAERAMCYQVIYQDDGGNIVESSKRSHQRPHTIQALIRVVFRQRAQGLH